MNGQLQHGPTYVMAAMRNSNKATAPANYDTIFKTAKYKCRTFSDKYLAKRK